MRGFRGRSPSFERDWDMARLVIHNYPTRSIGQFRATAPAQDHKDCGCGCGGRGDCKPSLRHRDSTSQADVAIDVRYAKGGKDFESRHYVVKDMIVNPKGQAPTPEFIRRQLGQNNEHQRMLQGGWKVDDVTGYYKGEQRNVGNFV
jgi:hypothetical protein